MKKFCLAAPLLLVFSTTPFAEETNSTTSDFYNSIKPSEYYAGLKLGSAIWGDLGSDVEDVTGIEDTQLSWGAFMGVQTLSWLAFEIGYQNLGEADLIDVSGSYDAQLIHLTTKLSYDFGARSSLYAKVGTQWYDWNANGKGVYENDNGWTPHLGAGFEMQLNKNWSGALEYVWYNDIGGPDMNYFGIAATYHW